MPIFNPTDPLAIPQLFQHQFDIDDVIHSLCGPAPVWLNTTNGSLSITQPSAPASHQFLIEPLPESFIGSLAHSPEQRLLNEEEQRALQVLLPTLTIAGLLNQLNQPTRLGGWLRERVKDVALEWLDTHNLIPPSMRHINRKTAPLPQGPAKVRLLGDA